MKRTLVVLVLSLLMAGTLSAQEAEAPGEATRFRAYNVVLDSGDVALGAYQLDVAATSGDVKIVGIEGGEHAAFARPPYYDPKAMQGDRVILAAFSTQKDLPKGKTRVARIHVQVTGDAPVAFAATLAAAASADGTKIEAKLSVTGQGEER
jgi:ketosteroid isomerase-like protein